MTIPYSKKVLRREFILGTFFTVLGIAFAWNEPGNILRYAFILIGMLHIASGIFQYRNPYLRVENDILRKSDFFPKHIRLSEVTRIKSFAGEHTLFTSEKKLKINSELVEKGSKAELEEFLSSLRERIEEDFSEERIYKNS